MIRRINNIKFRLDGMVQLEHGISKQIDSFWKKFKEENPKAYNESIVVSSNICECNNSFEIVAKKSFFSSVVYAKLKKKIKIRPLFSGGYIVTKDNYVGVVTNNQYILSKDNMLNLIGGMASTKDIVDGEYRCDECIKREVKEELGLDIDDSDFEYEVKYLKYPSKEDEDISCYPIGVIYEIRTSYTRDELTGIFENNIHDNEVKSIVFFSKDNYKDILKYKNRKEYLDELWKFLFKDICD